MHKDFFTFRNIDAFLQSMPIPIPDLQLSTQGSRQMVWDIVRRKWIVLTPEEMVRQAMLHFLHNHLQYPINWMAVEKQIQVNGLKKRFDILVYDKTMKPRIMVECKAPDVSINRSTFDQIARYNITIGVSLLVVTNGHDLYCAQINTDNQSITWLNEIPSCIDPLPTS
jgi:hypothetical protein